MVKIEQSNGTISITNEVFTNLAGDAATSCFGVKGMVGRSKDSGPFQLLRRESMSKGVNATFADDGSISLELHIAVDHGVNISALAHSIINEVYDYGKQVKAREGLVIMDTPGNDPASVAAMAAGGAQVVVFSSGRGSPIGSPIVPVIKITGNKITFANMEDNIDFNAAPLIYGERTVEELGQDLLAMVVETANGRQTKAEALGYTETAIARLCNYV